ncbi:MAG: hypothetical protein FWB79_06085 [Treponema sp.]|nr:hypothetical protein [Treponema sp.]
MQVDNPEFSAYGDGVGATRNHDGTYSFDGAAGSAGISFRFPGGWDGFDRVVFTIEAENLRREDGEMALIVNDGFKAWDPPVAKSPCPLVRQGSSVLGYPVPVFASGAVSFQLNETFGHSTNWKIAVKSVEFQNVEKKPVIVDNPGFDIEGLAPNKTPNADGSYTFSGERSALLCFMFPRGWKSFENVSFFVEGVENHVGDTMMCLIVKNGFHVWTTIDEAHGEQYPRIDRGGNVITYPTLAFADGASLQINKFGYSNNWTIRVTKIVLHDGPIDDVYLG